MKILLLLTLLLSGNVQAENERYYQDKLCENIGISEVVLEDRTRVDCLTFGMAIEVEFANKWKDSIGQALHYSLMTRRQPGIALIMLTDKDCKYLMRLVRVVKSLRNRISLWEIGPYAYRCQR